MKRNVGYLEGEKRKKRIGYTDIFPRSSLPCGGGRSDHQLESEQKQADQFLGS